MELTARIRANHEKLSSVSHSFLASAAQKPELFEPLDTGALPDEIRRYIAWNAWPLFVDRSTLDEIKEAAVTIFELVKKVPQRIFDNDPTRVSDYYELGNKELAQLILEEPNGLDGAVGRGDFILDDAGFKCLEANIGGNCGGLEDAAFPELYTQHAPIREILEGEGTRAHCRESARIMLRHVVRDSIEKSVTDGGVLNIAVVLKPKRPLREWFISYLDRTYQSILKGLDNGLEGRVVGSDYSGGFTKKGPNLYSNDIRIHAVIEATRRFTEEPVLSLFKSGAITVYGGPMALILSDKRNFSLLSTYQDTHVFDEHEREQICRLVPWTRDMRPGKVRYRDENIRLADLLISRREDLVIKKGHGDRGNDVHVGKFLSPRRWERKVEKAMAEGNWLVQEFLESRQYMFPCSEGGANPHSVIWGLFCFGAEYGGGFLRIMPTGAGRGVINADRGAEESMIFEV